jgi:hypothetical protein
MNLNPPKLKPVHIAVIAVVLAIVIAVPMMYFWILPLRQENATLRSSIDGLEAQSSPQQLEAAERGIQEAQTYAEQIEDRFERVQTRLFRIGTRPQVLDLSNPFNAVQVLSYERSQTLGPILVRWLNSQGNRLVSDITVPAAPANPNQIPREVITNSFSVQVAGTFDSVMRLLRAAQQVPRLVRIDNVTLTSGAGEGQAPTGAINAAIAFTVLVFPETPDTVPLFPVPGGADAGGMGMAPGLGAPGMGMPPGMAGPPIGPPGGPGGPAMGPPPGAAGPGDIPIEG